VAGFDVITDSVAGKDKIDLAAINAIAKGKDNAFTFKAGESLHGTAGELRAETGSGSTMIMGDISGDVVAEFHIRLTCVAGRGR
jgi:serralysin